jgi:hypothetical protein
MKDLMGVQTKMMDCQQRLGLGLDLNASFQSIASVDNLTSISSSFPSMNLGGSTSILDLNGSWMGLNGKNMTSEMKDAIYNEAKKIKRVILSFL